MSIFRYLHSGELLFSIPFSFGHYTESFLFDVFIVIIIIFLVFDLGYLNRSAHKTSTRSAFYQSIFWIAVSCIFGLLIYLSDTKESHEDTLAFFSCYLTEKALSIDNIFVILVILKYFDVEEKYYHKILFWGILGAIIFRGIFIFAGVFLVEQFHWVLYIFGAFLMYSGFKIFFEKDHNKLDPEDNPILKICRKYLPISQEKSEGRFIITKPKFKFTPLFLVIVLIESSDVIFAMDSIPAAFAITQNDFLIYTSNIFAVMGLRAMFFLIAGVIDKFYLLQKELAFILMFIGIKMLVEIFGITIPNGVSFITIFSTLVLSILLSIAFPKKTA